MTPGLDILAVIDDGVPRDAIVDCGNCPVNIACMSESGGTGHKFDCCGSTAVFVRDDDGNGLHLVVDCARNKLDQSEEFRKKQPPFCGLCNGDDVEYAMRGPWHDAHAIPIRWLPTVHARVPAGMRLARWRVRWRAARAKLAQEAARKAAAKGTIEP